MKKVSLRPHRVAFLRKWWQLIILVLAFSSAAAQENRYAPILGHGFKYKRITVDSVLLIPLYESTHIPYRAGAIKYRASDSSIYVYTGTQWIKIIGSGGGGDAFWELDGSNNLVNITFPGSKVEIDKRISILDSGFVATSSLSGTNPGEGTGYKTFWHPGKAAFRSGFTDASSFNDAFIGNYSNSFGYNATATGLASFSVGISTLASGQASAAWGGSGTQATGNNSTAGGLGSVSSGNASVAFGNSANATGASSFAAGFGPAANGVASAAFNQTTRADADYSAAFGEGSDVNAKGGFVSGLFNQTNYSLIIPQFSIGKYNDTTISKELLRVGFGVDGTNRKNVYSIDTAGQVKRLAPIDATTGYSILVWDPADGYEKKIDVGDISGAAPIRTETQKPVSVLAGDSTLGIPDTLVVLYDNETITIDPVDSVLKANTVYVVDGTQTGNRTFTQDAKWFRFRDGVDWTQFEGGKTTIQPDSAAGFTIREIKPAHGGDLNQGIYSWYEHMAKADQAPGRPNYPYIRGFNLSSGGGLVTAGLPAIGESWEPHYLPDPAGSPHLWLQEYHKFYVTPQGVQRRLESYTISTNNNLIQYYMTLNNWALRDTASEAWLASSKDIPNQTAQLFLTGTEAGTGLAITADNINNVVNFQPANSLTTTNLEANQWNMVSFPGNTFNATGFTTVQHNGPFNIQRTSSAAILNFKSISNIRAYISADDATGYVDFQNQATWGMRWLSDASVRMALIPQGGFMINTSGLSDVNQYSRKFFVNGSLGANVDSIDKVTVTGDHEMLVQDVTTGKFHRADVPAPGGGSGDVISNETSNTDGQIPLFGTQTDGKHLKKFAGTGFILSTSGVASAVASTGSGNVVLATSPAIVTPAIASFANAGHNHENSAGGGQIDEDAFNFTDVNTMNSTTGRHGLLPKLSGNSGNFLDGTGSWSTPAGASYTFSTGLTDAAGTVTNNLSTGVSGGQSAVGGTASGNNITISSTSHATKGKQMWGSASAYDEANIRLGINLTSPTAKFHLNVDAIGSTPADANGIVLSNSTAASAGAQQEPPTLTFDGNGWKTNATAASQNVKMRLRFVPVQGASAPTWQLLFQSSIAGGAYSNPFNMTSDGTFTAGGQLTAGTHLAFAGTGQIIASSRFRIAPQADGVVAFLNSGQTDFTRLQFGGTTTSFPALNRNGANLRVQLADGSASSDLEVLDEALSSSFDGSLEVPTKNAIYDWSESNVTKTLWRDFTITASTGTSETDLYTYTTPANTLSADGQFLEYEVTGVLDPTNNTGGINKTLRFYWAGVELHEQSSTFDNFSIYTARVRIVRVSSSNVRAFITFSHGPIGSGSTQTILNVSNDLATTFSGTNIIKVTGQSANASEQMDVRYGVLRKTP